uniref:Uncharacterized protein n=1 Tax=Panagrolaimus sp. ES5 TaxID=591445 RepID=A0AC34FG96_9BILA
MFRKVNFVHTTKLFTNSKRINFGENFGFDLIFYRDGIFGPAYYYQIKNIYDDFEITKITTIIGGVKEIEVLYNKEYYIFPYDSVGSGIYTFYISANIKVNIEKNEMCIVKRIETRTINVSETRLQLLKLHQYFKSALILYTNNNYLQLPYYVKKVNGNNIEICIDNPHNIEIEGKKGDYKIEQCGTKSIELRLTFLYDPSITSKSKYSAINSKKTTQNNELLPKTIVSSDVSIKKSSQKKRRRVAKNYVECYF